MERDRKPIVLVVDDEPNILQGLRRMMRSKRDSWSMEFMEGGRQALDRLMDGPVDVLVCDMRMPDVDGTKVLAMAANLYPESIRIILSGHAETEAMLEGLAAAHQFLPKPCDSATIISAIEESLALRVLLPLDALRQLVGQFTILPTPSERYFQLIRELDYPSASAKSVGAALENDLGLSVLVLRLVNSPFFAIPHRITKCRDAVEMLGFDTIRALVTLSEFYLRADMDPAMVAESQALATESLRIASLARQIAKHMGCEAEAIENAATAGLLSHIGTSLLQLNRPLEFKQIMAKKEDQPISIADIEASVFGAGHGALGAYLIGIWGFPNAVVEAVAFHHHPSAAGRQERGPLAAVHLAQAFASAAESDFEEETERDGTSENAERLPIVDEAYLKAIGFHDTSLAALAKEIKIVRTNSD
ncbi:MAG: HDOD domain-containing protein [Alphaproteobacteria bacterium]|nr:HDOD domain-containing protein [Alphaproteobacteria bacterium]